MQKAKKLHNSKAITDALDVHQHVDDFYPIGVMRRESEFDPLITAIGINEQIC